MELLISMLKGISVVLYNREEIEKDPFGKPLYKEIPVIVDDVLVAPSSTEDITTSTDLVGKVAKYTLAIPKSDTHVWENKKVHFFDRDWKVLGFVIQGIDDNIPLRWNKKVMVEAYE